MLRAFSNVFFSARRLHFMGSKRNLVFRSQSDYLTLSYIVHWGAAVSMVKVQELQFTMQYQTFSDGRKCGAFSTERLSLTLFTHCFGVLLDDSNGQGAFAGNKHSTACGGDVLAGQLIERPGGYSVPDANGQDCEWTVATTPGNAIKLILE